MDGSIANKVISTKDSIDEVGSDKVIIKANNKRFVIEFLTSGARLVFAK